MKKRLPTIIVLSAAFLTGIILYFAGGSNPNNEKDSDGDGFPDRIDQCAKVFSNKNSGCPEKQTVGEDNDRDGYYSGFLKDPKKIDPDDNNACVPNIKCDACDEDGDGLTYSQEIAKRTNPTNMDSDQDDVNDKVDRCPLEYGHTENEGCVLIVDAMLKRKGITIQWNKDLQTHAKSIRLTVISNKDGRELWNEFVTSNFLSIAKLIETPHCHAELFVDLKNKRAVTVINALIIW